ncbi:MAG: trypsin-like peptidase domain-containing protein [Candidatus Hydrogenedentes bacterium]|nr:trypsin-like peptidase domain-containing protein [Candidatus Hydrogenedentota bacterium]
MSQRVAGFFAAVVFAIACMGAQADELADKGRQILEKHRLAVVTIKLVIKQQISMPGFGSQDMEDKAEVTGTVVDPSGLTVVALSETDPTSMFQNMAEMSGEDMQGLEMNSQVSDLKILTEDGTEIPGQIVLRDKDLDLAFVRPLEAPKEPLPAVDLANAGNPQILDPLITINRLGRVAGRAYSCSIERVDSVVTKPRTLYIPGNDPTQTGLGSPVFTLDGQLVGLMVMRSVKGGSGMMSMMRGMGDMSMAVIVPSADIAEVAAQAPAAGEEVKELGTEEPAPAEEPAAEGTEDTSQPSEEQKSEEAPTEPGDAPSQETPATGV